MEKMGKFALCFKSISLDDVVFSEIKLKKVITRGECFTYVKYKETKQEKR